MFVGGGEAPVSVKQESGEIRAEVKYRGDVQGLETIKVEEGEVGSMLFTELVNVWEVISVEGEVERDVLECW